MHFGEHIIPIKVIDYDDLNSAEALVLWSY